MHCVGHIFRPTIRPSCCELLLKVNAIWICMLLLMLEPSSGPSWVPLSLEKLAQYSS
jgi:hypothetical protein